MDKFMLEVEKDPHKIIKDSLYPIPVYFGPFPAGYEPDALIEKDDLFIEDGQLYVNIATDKTLDMETCIMTFSEGRLEMVCLWEKSQ